MRTVTAPILAIAALTILTGCSAAPSTADPSRLPGTPPVATPTPTPSPTESEAGADFGERVVNDRGNLVKEVGQLAGTGRSDNQDLLTSQFAVTDIVVDVACTAEFADVPANGHFIGIHLNVETTRELAQDEIGTLSFSQWGWQAFDADGKRVNDPLGNARWCMDAGDQLPSDIGPAQSVSGWIVLDVPTPTGSVALTMGAANGWEWSY
ncbi:DUF4352 domain-containing protein [Microbacterium flavescens]|uniref:DUF4352 domain-containing protein n=1 Tax=Microbacterium flavescens TaxID=69366 RepID=UPI001BDEEA35|nr:DUF4352 domain-containing protein [Microbacterium flavescens]BFF12250.1 hypothetical protein GCM10025699_35530 [Microbacterium flavescens]